MTKLLPAAQPIYDTLLAAQNAQSPSTQRIARSQAVHVANWYSQHRPGQSPSDADRDHYAAARVSAGASKRTVENEWSIVRRYVRNGPAYSTPQSRAAGVAPTGSRVAAAARAHDIRQASNVTPLRPAAQPASYNLGDDRETARARLAGQRTLAPELLDYIIDNNEDSRNRREGMLLLVLLSGIGPHGVPYTYKRAEALASIQDRHARSPHQSAKDVRALNESGRLIGGLHPRDDLWDAITDRIGVTWGLSEYHRLLWSCREHCCVRRIDMATICEGGQSVGELVTLIDRLVTLTGTMPAAQYAAHLSVDARAHYDVVAEQFAAAWGAKEKIAALRK